MKEIEKIDLKGLKFSDAGVKACLREIRDRLNKIIEWINEEEKHRDRAKRLL